MIFFWKLNIKQTIAGLEKKIPDVTDFLKKIKITELENKLPNVSNLATNNALTEVENKIPDVSSLVKKPIINKKLIDMKENVQSLMLWLLIFLMQD